ncbi:hypothetical protein ABPG77_007354 [Micractinium sp. CCAP 211/92]
MSLLRLLLLSLAALAVSVEAVAEGSLPSLILMSLDGGILPSTWDLAYKQTIMPMTWFTCCCLHGKDTGDCGVVQQAYELGHEMASHTMTHSEETLDYTRAEWATEIGGQRSWLADECGIPADQVVGFRAPNFRINNLMGEVLADLQFDYDSSLGDLNYTQRAGQMNGTFDLSPCQEDAEMRARCGDWDELPLYEVPAYKLAGSGKRMDPLPLNGKSVLQRFQEDFERKRGLGVPTSINVHEPYLADSDSRSQVVAFLKWAFAQPGDTWAITHQQYMEWVAAPPGTPVEDIVARYPCDAS